MRGGGDGLPTLRGIVAQTMAGVCGEEQVLVLTSACGAYGISRTRCGSGTAWTRV